MQILAGWRAGGLERRSRAIRRTNERAGHLREVEQYGQEKAVRVQVQDADLPGKQVGDIQVAAVLAERKPAGALVKGYLEKDRESIYRAVQLDPLTSSLLSLSQIRQMVGEMFEAHKTYIDF